MPVLPSTYTAFEIVLMGRNPHLGLFEYEGNRDMEIAWQAMGRTGTQHLAERRISELSGGEIQSVVIARALTQQTEAMLLDEPTANLDVGRQIEILGLIKSLCYESEMTVVAALHDLNLAVHYCDRVVLISSGGIHAKGTPEQVITTENIEQVYGYGSYVHTHPLTGLPAVLPRVASNRKADFKKDKGGG
jgi:iron complex transport system ATP-binding protein